MSRIYEPRGQSFIVFTAWAQTDQGSDQHCGSAVILEASSEHVSDLKPRPLSPHLFIHQEPGLKDLNLFYKGTILFLMNTNWLIHVAPHQYFAHFSHLVSNSFIFTFSRSFSCDFSVLSDSLFFFSMLHLLVCVLCTLIARFLSLERNHSFVALASVSAIYFSR